jgi:hypothetical protein
MPRPVHKVVLPNRAKSKVDLPEGSILLKTGTQIIENVPRICLWYISGSGDETEVEFVQIGTGDDAPDGFSYLGTVQFSSNGSELVQHQFFKPKTTISKAI